MGRSGAVRLRLPACGQGGGRGHVRLARGVVGAQAEVGWRTGQAGRQGRSGTPKVQGLGQSKGGAGRSHSHFSPSLSQDRLTGGLLLMLTHVKFKASPGRSADALARIVKLVGGTSRTGPRSEIHGGRGGPSPASLPQTGSGSVTLWPSPPRQPSRRGPYTAPPAAWTR